MMSPMQLTPVRRYHLSLMLNGGASCAVVSSADIVTARPVEVKSCENKAGYCPRVE